MEISQTQNSLRPNDFETILTKSQKKKLRKKERLAALKENLKDRRPPKGANNPLNEALFSDDEEAMDFTQNSQPASSNAHSNSLNTENQASNSAHPGNNGSSRTEDKDNSSINDAFEGFGQIVMDRPLHPRSVPIPLKRDNKLPT
jgi:hypothetical protein